VISSYIGAILRSFFWLDLLAWAVSIRMLQWLDGAAQPPKYFLKSCDKTKNLTNSGTTIKKFNSIGPRSRKPDFISSIVFLLKGRPDL